MPLEATTDPSARGPSHAGEPDSSRSEEELLTIDELEVGFARSGAPRSGAPDEYVVVLRRVSFGVRRGELLGLVGESGCGKSLTALAILGLLPGGGKILGGRVRLAGVGNLLELDPAGWRRCRGRRIAMIFQEPASALNPLLTIGFQIAESLRVHRGLSRRAARRAAGDLLERVAMPDPGRRLRSYPHELSGGQRQRAMIAIALASEPDLLLADEPTTALDVTVQAQIIELLQDLRKQLGLTVLLITHDLGVVAECCDRVTVMYAGQVVEQAPVGELFRNPAHPYSRALLAAVPRLETDGRGVIEAIPGQVPEPGALPGGCTFHPRCPAVDEPCRCDEPEPYELSREHRVRCFLHRDGGALPAVAAGGEKR
ncbi:MAG: ABC transporter ATP-binding protein [bacterium]|nr:ABC transporter ATP-binding protein [bacterium]